MKMTDVDTTLVACTVLMLGGLGVYLYLVWSL